MRRFLVVTCREAFAGRPARLDSKTKHDNSPASWAGSSPSKTPAVIDSAISRSHS